MNKSSEHRGRRKRWHYKIKDVNLNFILHVYGTADDSGKWSFKGTGGRGVDRGLDKGGTREMEGEGASGTRVQGIYRVCQGFLGGVRGCLCGNPFWAGRSCR